ncbi:hypothetical protein DXV75_06265 [Alteromonas aestuariivivens]|uniref:Uncharacterized protein n=1 Tax=Alteromonas aestuariivivens TaxID=1938339 RepID=A0A3D8M9E5_9ALTE|nr:hypothetical protein DXV75_06265 [Alteromonas aestuariivivens]
MVSPATPPGPIKPLYSAVFAFSALPKINSLLCYRCPNFSVIISRPFYGGMYIKAAIPVVFSSVTTRKGFN